MTVLFGGRLQGWFALIGLPWNLPAMPCVLVGPPLTLDRTRSQLFFFSAFFFCCQTKRRLAVHGKSESTTLNTNLPQASSAPVSVRNMVPSKPHLTCLIDTVSSMATTSVGRHLSKVKGKSILCWYTVRIINQAEVKIFQKKINIKWDIITLKFWWRKILFLHVNANCANKSSCKTCEGCLQYTDILRFLTGMYTKCPPDTKSKQNTN